MLRVMSMRLAALALLPALLTGCATDGLGTDDRVVSGSVEATPSSAAVASSAPSAPVAVRCEDLPHLWSGAHDIAYDPESGVVRFGWPDGTTANVLDSALGCAAQPGLERQLAEHRVGAEASERASCRELQHLVDAVRAARRERGESTSGSVPVSDAAAASAAEMSGVPPGAAVPKPGSGERMIDLDASDRVLEQCPQ
jgi:hypothetical protein